MQLKMATFPKRIVRFIFFFFFFKINRVQAVDYTDKLCKFHENLITNEDYRLNKKCKFSTQPIPTQFRILTH